jgi:glycine cleavage system aminomethyltransferase T
MLPIEFTELGTELQVETPKSGRVAAKVVQMPHWDPTKEIPRG